MKEAESWFIRANTEAEKGIPKGERGFGIALVVFNILII